jgi:hypothetical protein
LKKIALIGSNIFSQQLIYYFESTGLGTVVGMFDDFEAKFTIKHDRPILGRISEAPQLFNHGVFDYFAN